MSAPWWLQLIQMHVLFSTILVLAIRAMKPLLAPYHVLESEWYALLYMVMLAGSVYSLATQTSPHAFIRALLVHFAGLIAALILRSLALRLLQRMGM